MAKKIKFGIIIILLLILVILGIIIVSKYFHDQKLLKVWEQKVENYLIDEKGYSKEEILRIKGIHSWTKHYGMGGCLEYIVEVRFSDEPKAVYYYCADNSVRQDGYNGKLHIGR